MMRFMAGCSGAWALAAIVLVGCGASAQMMVVEGYADVNLALITPGTIVCSTRVSGEDSEELFALDTKTGTVTWRQRDQRIDAKALADETGAFYLFANDFLQKRDLRTGVIVWQSKLDSIPEQITPPKLSLEDYWQIFLTRLKLAPPPPMTLSLRSFSSPPNCYYYETVASRSALNVFRQAMHSAGCELNLCFSDWLTFDPKTGKKISGGSGEFLGNADATALIQDQSNVSAIVKGRLREIRPPGMCPSPFGFDSFMARRRRGQHSWNKRCLLGAVADGGDEIFIFDDRTREISSFHIPKAPDSQVNWVMLDKHILRYAECPAYSSEGKRSNGSPWFELYDLGGRRIARTESTELGDDNWYLRFLGTSSTGKAMFHDDKRIIALEIPSLSLTLFPRPPTKRTPEGEWHSSTSREMVRGSNQLYEIEGNTTLSKMSADPLPHEFHISVLDVETGQRLWNHVEPVRIRKIPQAGNRP